jgi:hypothetical protein
MQSESENADRAERANARSIEQTDSDDLTVSNRPWGRLWGGPCAQLPAEACFERGRVRGAGLAELAESAEETVEVLAGALVEFVEEGVEAGVGMLECHAGVIGGGQAGVDAVATSERGAFNRVGL